MTVVGDLAQAVAARIPLEWRDILRSLPRQPGQRVMQLTINYRTPSEIMALADRVLATARPSIPPPTSVRSTGDEPEFVHADEDSFASAVAATARALHHAVAPGTVAILSPEAVLPVIQEEMPDAVFDGLDAPIALMPVRDAKGLEFDAVVVVEPAALVAESAQGMHALYVALTRATKRVAVVHAQELPSELLVDEPAVTVGA